MRMIRWIRKLSERLINTLYSVMYLYPDLTLLKIENPKCQSKLFFNTFFLNKIRLKNHQNILIYQDFLCLWNINIQRFVRLEGYHHYYPI